MNKLISTFHHSLFTFLVDVFGLNGPGEVKDGQFEEAVGAIQNAGQSAPPGQEGSNASNNTGSLVDVVVIFTLGELEIRVGHKNEGDINTQEKGKEGNSGSQGADQHDGSEDEPADNVQANSVVKLSSINTISSEDTEEVVGEHNGITEPETSIRSQGGGTEGVTNSHFPHTSKQLDQATISEGKANSYIRENYASSLSID